MADRRSLVEGLKPAPQSVDKERERQFVYAETGGEGAVENATPTRPVATRSPISTRIRADLASALKRASLERQLEGKEPNTLCDILEQAIEPWLRANKYIP